MRLAFSAGHRGFGCLILLRQPSHYLCSPNRGLRLRDGLPCAPDLRPCLRTLRVGFCGHRPWLGLPGMFNIDTGRLDAGNQIIGVRA